MLCLNYIAAYYECLGIHKILDLLNDTLCYVDNALYQEEQNCSHITQKLQNFTEVS